MTDKLPGILKSIFLTNDVPKDQLLWYDLAPICKLLEKPVTTEKLRGALSLHFTVLSRKMTFIKTSTKEEQEEGIVNPGDIGVIFFPSNYKEPETELSNA